MQLLSVWALLNNKCFSGYASKPLHLNNKYDNKGGEMLLYNWTWKLS